MKEQVINMKKAETATPLKNEFVTSPNVGNEFNAYYRKANSYANLSAEEEKIIALKAQQGDKEAKKILVQSNLKLVLTIARKAIHISKLPLVDLIQEGNLGLMVAVEKFNPTLG